MKKYFIPASIVFGFSLLLSACGGGGATTEIDVLMTDFAFEPMEFTVPAGQEITVNATNNGAVEHEFVIFNFGTDAGETFDDEDEANIYWEVEVQPGQSATTSFVAPTEPGVYTVTCGIEGHLEAGMSGLLTVVAAE
ncbi:MAG: cupredoxin domain-containing protein [Anaerolineales bacterium]|nr:cupredoxin domain-containing protein [Anaerolineales bacterium]